MRNARQILDIVTATFSSSSSASIPNGPDCTRPGSPAEELACEWQRISEIVETASMDDLGDDWIADVSQV